MNISLDGQSQPEFIHEIDNTNTFQYNGTVYSNSDLTSGIHVFFMSADALDPGSLLLFDYAIYTYVFISLVNVVSRRNIVVY